MVDDGRFLIILAMFMFGFSIQVATLNQPFWDRDPSPIEAKTITTMMPSGSKCRPF